MKTGPLSQDTVSACRQHFLLSGQEERERGGTNHAGEKGGTGRVSARLKEGS